MTPGQALYRYEDAPLVHGRPPSYAITEWVVIRITPCMAFLRRTICGWSGGKTRRMKLNAIRPFAHENKRDAAYAYAQRKFRHIEHARRSLEKARMLFDDVKRANKITMAEPPDEWFAPTRLGPEDY